MTAPKRWEPIETAPSDGSPVLVWCPGSGEHFSAAMYVAHIERGLWFSRHWVLKHQPTRWMRLPEAPR